MKKIFSIIMFLCVACMASATNYLTFTAEEDNSTFGIQKAPDLWYSLDDGATWNALVEGDTIVLKKKGDKALLKGVNSDGIQRLDSKSSSFTNFLMTGKIAASGSIMSLIDGVGETTVIPSIECFSMLFFNCTSLTQAPELPATTLTDYCYERMFSGCTNLTKAPELPATTLEVYCYSHMFADCKSLKQVPDLHATTLAEKCCYGMFWNCSSLEQAPELPATIMAESCYDCMFFGCASLKKAPQLPATVVASGCYSEMFFSCHSLTEAPELPAKVLAPSCYYGMFNNCEGLTKAPELNATTLAIQCYSRMFEDCENLSEIKVSFDEWGRYKDTDNDKTWFWNTNVSPTGLFVCPANLPLKFGGDNIPVGWNVKYLEMEDVEDPNYLTIISKEDDSVLGVVNVGNASTISYSLDEGETWIPLEKNELNIQVKKGEGVLLKGVVTSSSQLGELAGTTSVSSEETNVWTEDGVIYVSGAKGEVSLFDFSGRCVSTSELTAGIHALTVPTQGVYIVKTNNKAISVLVR